METWKNIQICDHVLKSLHWKLSIIMSKHMSMFQTAIK